MNKLFDAADIYLKKATWKDLALVKFCLASIGLLAGLSVPQKHKKTAAIGAIGVLIATYIPLMADFLSILFREKPEAGE